MNRGRKTSRWCRHAVSCLAALCLLISPLIVFGQPAHAPPKAITVETAAKQLGGPTSVTLNVKDAEPSGIFEALAAQTGISFDDYSARDHLASRGKVSFDYQAQPMWHVLRALASKLDVSLKPYQVPRFNGNPTGVEIRIVPGSDLDLDGPVCEAGPFLVIASRAARSLSLAPSKSQPGAQRVVLEFVVLVDPKIRTRGEPEGFELEILDGDGRPLTVAKSQAATWTRQVTSHSPLIWTLSAWAELADADVRSLQKVSGSLRFVTSTSSQRWEVKDVLQVDNTVKRIENTTFAIRNVVPCEYAGPAYAVTLGSWGRGERADFGWPPRSIYDRVSAVRLLDAGGNQLSIYAWQEQENRDLRIIFKSPGANPDGRSEPAMLVWDLPTEVSEIEVPFEFPDLPLP